MRPIPRRSDQLTKPDDWRRRTMPGPAKERRRNFTANKNAGRRPPPALVFAYRVQVIACKERVKSPVFHFAPLGVSHSRECLSDNANRIQD